jgi:serine/threonine protein kinase
VLSDFGIAATLGEAESSDAVGLSIPWSAPEVLHDEVSGSVASEVWSLGATVYSLLAGRSPFETPGGDNGSGALMARIDKAKYTPTGRIDVPKGLEQVLARSMSLRPSARQSSALEFVRDLQAVEEELGLSQTPLEVAMDDWALATAVDVDEQTRISGAHGSGEIAPRRRRPRGGSLGAARSEAESRPRDVGTSRIRTTPPTSVRLAWGISLVSVLLIALVGAGAFFVIQGTRSIPVVTDVQGVDAGGTVTFSWNDPGLQSSDAYLVTVDGETQPLQREPRLTVAAEDGDRVCASVRVVRDGKSGDSSAERCVEVSVDIDQGS